MANMTDGKKLPRLVLTGGSGLLALNWAARMNGTWEVVLLQHRRQVPVPFAQVRLAELSSPEETERVITELAPDLVVNTAALTNVEFCERDPDRAHRTNADLAGALAAAACKAGAGFVQISTDHLFDGLTPMRTESDAPRPCNTYAASKAAGEAAVLEAHPEALVLRTNFFGWGPLYRSSFSDVVLRALRAGRHIDLFEDAFFTPIFVDDLVDLAHALVAQGARGVFNIAGPERLSKLAFGQRLAAAFGLDPAAIRSTRLAERTDLIRRPLDMSLDDSRLVSVLGHRAPPLDAALERLATQESGHPVKGLGPFMIPYGRHHIDAEDRAAVAEFLSRDGWLTQGPTVEAFERAIADKVGARHAVAVSSATAGLHIAALAAGLGPGKKMITSPITFVASANAATYTGADVVFCDIDPATANLDPDAVEAALAADPTICAIMPVHFGGLPCNMTRLQELAGRFGVAIIEDAAHALGATYPCGRSVGCGHYGDMAVFSFHPVKAIALGEGGMVTTNDEAHYRTLLRLRSHGINKLNDGFEFPEEAGPWYYEMQDLGFNYRITDLQCALGLSQARKLDRFITRRRALAARYDRRLAGWKHLRRAQGVDTSASAHHVYVLQVDFETLGTTRTAFMNALKEQGIGSQVHYIPVPMQPYYRRLGHGMAALPNARTYYDQALTIPLYYELSDAEQDQVIAALAELTGNRVTERELI